MLAAKVLKVDELHVGDYEKPCPGPGEALIKVLYTGICGTDVHVMKGHHRTAKLPVILGHEFVGLVEEVYNPGSGLMPGDYVAVQPYKSCGVCDACLQGSDNVCRELEILGVHRNGSFAEYVTVPVKKVFHLPEQLSPRLAALVEPLAVAVHDVRKSRLKAGETALVIGGGPIGLLMALVARHSGARKVVISEVNEWRLEFARKLGFETINPVKQDALAIAGEMTDGRGFNVVYEVSGSKPGIALMTKAVGIAGRVIIIGIPGEGVPVDLTDVYSKELEVLGVRLHYGSSFRAAIDIMEEGKINRELGMLITKEFELAKAVEAMEFTVSEPNNFKTVIKVSEHKVSPLGQGAEEK